MRIGRPQDTVEQLMDDTERKALLESVARVVSGRRSVSVATRGASRGSRVLPMPGGPSIMIARPFARGFPGEPDEAASSTSRSSIGHGRPGSEGSPVKVWACAPAPGVKLGDSLREAVACALRRADDAEPSVRELLDELGLLSTDASRH